MVTPPDKNTTILSISDLLGYGSDGFARVECAYEGPIIQLMYIKAVTSIINYKLTTFKTYGRLATDSKV